MEIVRESCDAVAVGVHSRKSLGARAGSVQRSCEDGGVTLRGSQDHRTIFCPNDSLENSISARSASGLCTMLLRHVYGLRAYDFFFQICHKSSLNKIVEATAPVNPYGNCTADACLCTEAAWAPYGLRKLIASQM